MTISLVILLHGVGSNGSDLAPIADHLAHDLPGTAFETPDGTQPFDMGGPGRQWFSVSGVTTQNRPARIIAARPAFDGVIARLAQKHGLQDQPHRIALLGFSQGTIMALDAFATGRWQTGAVVGFSGRLATDDPLTPVKGGRVLLVHGTGDRTIPAQESEQAAARLTAAGAAAQVTLLPGLGHTISAQGLQLAASFLKTAS
ncbi:phospholipase/carboxylesterase (plasmid) [Ketogulonicigenium robustum]|uniref:Phospholipase/carboxylesterase n=1 Tax=Ketogulonicigenium robustum TaxID=92947 RepID=A0A1W6P2W6_9RHOB|nr:dienelactone hydrolase family protein [Ketogulonicigenium robustum]ARO15858.1 phospholipase/carboxylesterase [Ketogulonicigenium robustum]